MKKQDFYYGLKARVEAGQYTMAEITAELDKRLGQGWITDNEYVELLELALNKIDLTYDGNKNPTNYDLEQDLVLLDLDMALIEVLDMVLGLMSVQTATQQSKMATFMIAGRSIADSYVRLIIAGRKTFDEVQDIYKQEVADKLIAQGREDLITDPNYLPVKEVDPEFGVAHE